MEEGTTMKRRFIAIAAVAAGAVIVGGVAPQRATPCGFA
jgi:hypothetical protein